MMVRHNNGHAKLFGQAHLLQGRNAIITGNNGVNAVFLRLADDGLVDAVAIPDALRNLIVHMTAAPA